MLKRIFKNEKGLTLIELLAVVVILGIIAAIAVPSIGNIIDNSRDKAQVAEAIQIINAAKLSQAEKGTPEKGWKHEADTDYIALKGYIDGIDDDSDGYTVTVSNGEYKITGHPACALFNEDEKTDYEVSLTELQNFTTK